MKHCKQKYLPSYILMRKSLLNGKCTICFSLVLNHKLKWLYLIWLEGSFNYQNQATIYIYLRGLIRLIHTFQANPCTNQWHIRLFFTYFSIQIQVINQQKLLLLRRAFVIYVSTVDLIHLRIYLYTELHQVVVMIPFYTFCQVICEKRSWTQLIWKFCPE